MILKLKGWFQERLPVSGEQIRELTNEPVPNHMKHWWFCLGGTPAFLFLLQIVTGILLSFYYSPSTLTAYESVKYISESVPYGHYIRGLHKWGATFFIASIILHQMRVYFSGAYRYPREINWMIGMCILLCSTVLGFTGYSLIYEQLSFWGATVGANIADSIPFIGPLMKKVLLGGEAYNANTINRFFILHAAVLPCVLAVLLFIHISILRIQGISELEFSSDKKQKNKVFNFFPDHLFTEIIMALILMILLSALTTLFPAHLGEKANPLITPEMIKPEWYFYTVFRWLKLFSGTFAVLSTGFIIFLMFSWPFIDSWFRRKTKYQEASVWIGLFSVLIIISLTAWEALVVH
ncbi:MAG: cytochrome bc complex cytochrome b subunit [Bacteriovoracales bacterium]|nr:cytochrome bc complex cytochrome b subunit [Bacteriovoracales bacterium]